MNENAKSDVLDSSEVETGATSHIKFKYYQIVIQLRVQLIL